MSALPQLKDAALSLEDRVGILTFKRDDVRNALTSTEIATDIVNTIAWANATMDISVLIITGEGSAFSAGGNIKTMGERSKAAPHLLQQAYKSGIQRIPLALQDAEIPVIAAVNGPAIGAGFDLANMCDIRIGSTNAQFGETFANLGLIAGDGGGWFVDYPRADENLSARLSEVTRITIGRDTRGRPRHMVATASDPDLDLCPFVMMSEPGGSYFNSEEASNLRAYLLKGGFLWVDDFWGEAAWEQWAHEIGKALLHHEKVTR